MIIFISLQKSGINIEQSQLIYINLSSQGIKNIHVVNSQSDSLRKPLLTLLEVNTYHYFHLSLVFYALVQFLNWNVC